MYCICCAIAYGCIGNSQELSTINLRLCRPYLQSLFAASASQGPETSVFHAGNELGTALVTCQDYTDEVACMAHPKVYNVFIQCLVRHLACCIACRMMLSTQPYDGSWQRHVHLEMRKLQRFLDVCMQQDRAAGEQCLAMLSLLRSLLCAPDSYTAVSSFKTVCLLLNLMRSVVCIML